MSRKILTSFNKLRTLMYVDLILPAISIYIRRHKACGYYLRSDEIASSVKRQTRNDRQGNEIASQ